MALVLCSCWLVGERLHEVLTPASFEIARCGLKMATEATRLDDVLGLHLLLSLAKANLVSVTKRNALRCKHHAKNAPRAIRLNLRLKQEPPRESNMRPNSTSDRTTRYALDMHGM